MADDTDTNNDNDNDNDQSLNNREIGPPGPAPPAELSKQITLYDTSTPQAAHSRRVASAKPKIRRIPTQKWGEVSNRELSAEHQWSVLLEIYDTVNQTPDTPPSSKWGKDAIRHIHTKIASYRHQDVLKAKYSETEFVDLVYVLQRLLDAQLTCFYCKGPVRILYEYVRESTQWTLERIDNSVGHNRGNVEIACLKCNLSRRCMFYERYKRTKEMTKVVKLGGDGGGSEGHTGVL
jgi:hypothetical protein